jgi:UDP-N-acetylmuramoylalanine--D-glutamate ligase
VVVGLGASGAAAARLCLRRGARVTGADDKPVERLPEAAALQAAGIRLAGGVRDEVLQGADLPDLIVLSPGVPLALPALQRARAAGVPIVGELELAAVYGPIAAPIVGITGTNGKSTVTSLCGAIAAQTGRPSFCGGNLGTPLCDAVDTDAAGAGGIVVCEMSSFQLETVDRLRCHAAAVLNLTPDHLDRYPDLHAYGDAKGRVFRHMPGDAARVLSADDPEVRALYVRAQGEAALSSPGVFWFSTRGEVARGGFVRGDELVLRGPFAAGDGEERYPLSALQLVGRHNQQNALAAFLLMRASGLATQAQVQAAARAFRPLPHRMELVAQVRGVFFYDDSKGTNVDAVVAGLDGFPRPYALIAGGRDKGGSYAPLAEVMRHGQVRGAVLIGEAAPLIEAALRGVTETVRAGSMDEAVARAAALCQPGDAVVLSPACSSYDMFRDYAHRAAVFCEAVRRLEGAHGAA